VLAASRASLVARRAWATLRLLPGAAITERPGGQVTALVVQQVKRHEQRRRGDGLGVRLAQAVEPRAELLVVDRDLAVEHERARRQLREAGCGRQVISSLTDLANTGSL